MSTTTSFNSFGSNSFGFTFIEILIALSLLSGSYFVILSTQQFLVSHSLKLEAQFLEILRSSDDHELEIALMNEDG
jgi:prepilin-type N-terminal cleavage/methylation domain-containing protein